MICFRRNSKKLNCFRQICRNQSRRPTNGLTIISTTASTRAVSQRKAVLIPLVRAKLTFKKQTAHRKPTTTQSIPFSAPWTAPKLTYPSMPPHFILESTLLKQTYASIPQLFGSTPSTCSISNATFVTYAPAIPSYTSGSEIYIGASLLLERRRNLNISRNTTPRVISRSILM